MSEPKLDPFNGLNDRRVSDEFLATLVQTVRVNHASLAELEKRLNEHEIWWAQMGIKGLSDWEREQFSTLLRDAVRARDEHWNERVRLATLWVEQEQAHIVEHHKKTEITRKQFAGIVAGAVMFAQLVAQVLQDFFPHVIKP